jgi:hypothetical protein
MTRTDPVKFGLALCGAVGLWHFAWAVCVAAGWAPVIVRWVLWAHFLSLDVRTETFSLARASILVVATGSLGFVFGFVTASAWNLAHRRRSRDMISRL